MEDRVNRRDFLVSATAASFALAVPPSGLSRPQAAASVARKGRIKQGVTMGVFARGTTLEDACREAARLGIKGFDLIGPKDWPLLRKYGLVPSMYPQGPGGTIPQALNLSLIHISEPTRLLSISYAVFCLKKKK